MGALASWEAEAGDAMSPEAVALLIRAHRETCGECTDAVPCPGAMSYMEQAGRGREVRPSDPDGLTPRRQRPVLVPGSEPGFWRILYWEDIYDDETASQ